MATKTDYISTNRTKQYLKCHLIFVCKYRKKLLINDVKTNMAIILERIAQKSDFTIEVMESDIDLFIF